MMETVLMSYVMVLIAEDDPDDRFLIEVRSGDEYAAIHISSNEVSGQIVWLW